VLSDPQKRAAYDRDVHLEGIPSSGSRSSRKNYAWKNPEFDPNYDHFAHLPEHLKNLGLGNPFRMFDDLPKV
jgi:curved DNA-binding protein CbpA